MAVTRTFGHLPNIPVGRIYANRDVLAQSGVHRPTMAGIAGGAAEGAESIVVSGGYEDDEDLGDLIVYTGQGGNDPATRKQIADQELIRGNLALARNATLGLPVRVVRGANAESVYAPPDGYRYDGLYVVETYWHEQGRSGYRVFRYRLRRDDVSPVPWATVPALPVEVQPPQRREVTSSRIVRDTGASRQVKELHDYRCQVCGTRLESAGGPYAEGAHIRPLGRPHDGPDIRENILCLCPNHHVLFDLGGFSIGDDLRLVGMEGTLRTAVDHRIDVECLRYHRERYRAV